MPLAVKKRILEDLSSDHRESFTDSQTDVVHSTDPSHSGPPVVRLPVSGGPFRTRWDKVDLEIPTRPVRLRVVRE